MATSMKRFRRLFQWLMMGLAGLLLLPFLVLLAINQPASQDWLAGLLERLLTNPDFTLELQQPRGTFPMAASLARLRLGDSRGIWLDVQGIRWEWSLSSLLDGVFHLKMVEVDHLSLLRPPPPSPPPPTEETTPFQLVAPPLPVRVDHLNLAHVALAEAVLGEKSDWQLQGQLTVDTHTTLQLDLARTDRTGVDLHLRAKLEPGDDPRLELSLEGQEASGLLARLTDQAASAVTLHWRGKGSLSHWSSQLQIDTPELTSLQAKLEIAGQPQWRAQLTGTLDPGSLLPANLKEMSQQKPLDLQAIFKLHEQNQISVELTKLAWTMGKITGQGHWNSTNQHWRSQGILELPELAQLAPITQTRMAGSGQLAWQASGTPTGNQVQYQVTTVGTATDQWSLATSDIHGKLQWQPSAIHGQWEGQLHGVALTDITSDLQLHGTFTHALPAQTTDFSLSWQAKNLRGLPPQAMALLGEEPSGEVGGSHRGSQAFTLDTMRVAGSHVTSQGTLSVNPASGQWLGHQSLEIPRMAVLSPSPQETLGGQLTMAADLSGTLESPALAMQVNWLNPQLAKQMLADLHLDIQGKNLLETPQGHWKLTTRLHTQPVTLESPFRWQKNQLTLPEIRLHTPGGTLAGHLVLDGQQGLTTGTLQGEIGELANWPLPQPLGGSLTARLDLNHSRGHQNAGLSWHLQQATLPQEITLEQWQGQLQGEDLLGQRRFHATSDINGLQQGEMLFPTTKLSLEGTPTQMTGQLTTTGRLARQLPMALDTSFQLQTAPQQVFTLQSLRGSLKGQPLILTAPAHLKRVDREIQLARTTLTLGPGRLTMAGESKQEKLRGDWQMDLPLTLAGLAGYPMGGQFTGSGTLAGTLEQPVIQATLQVRDARPGHQKNSSVPPLNLTTTLSYQGARFQAHMVGEKPYTVAMDLKTPMQINLATGDLGTQANQPVQGTWHSLLDLKPLGAWLGLDGQAIFGNLATDLTLAGTLNHPLLTGETTLQEGSYENGSTGTLLRQVALTAHIRNDRLDPITIRAHDGGDGWLSGQGWLDLNPHGHLDHRFQLDLQRAQLVRQDNLSTTVSGHLQMQGNGTRSKLQGEITANQLEYHLVLPDSGLVEPIAVEERRPGGKEGTRRKKAPKPAPPPFQTELDLTIDLPNRIMVYAPGLDSSWQGKLTIKGTSEEPKIQGELSVQKGSMAFLGHTFQLADSQLTLDGRHPPMPQLDIHAVEQRGTNIFTVDLKGSAEHPQLILGSEPPRSKDEILSLLLFNQDSETITPAQAIKLALAMKRLQSGSPGMLQNIQGMIGLDYLDLTGDDMETGTVKAGKNLSDRVYLEVEKGLTPGSGATSVEIHVTPQISVDAEIKEDASSGVGVFWKHHY